MTDFPEGSKGGESQDFVFMNLCSEIGMLTCLQITLATYHKSSFPEPLTMRIDGI